MEIFIILIIIQMVSLNRAFEFICPSQPHWRLRAKSMCKPPSNYTCLFDVNFQINVYRDKCSRPRILGPGYKYVFQPNLNRAACSRYRYQPFIFETIGYSDCTYQKSLCNSLGQETYDNSNSRSDTTCICNTDRGYTFVRNSNNQCYCNPSTEDCSCYLGNNPYNETVGLEDIKCYQEIKSTKRPYLEDMFNNSRTIKIIEFDNYKYNINHLSTNGNHTKALKWVLMLSLTLSVVCIILLIKTPSKAIYHFPEEDKIRFNKLLQTEIKEKRYFVRIMIVGKETVGKTCLLKRLLKEDISNVTSTDGVDIVVHRCKINTEDGKWIIGKEIHDDKVSRIKRALNPNAEDSDTQNMQVDETNIKISHDDDMSTQKRDTSDTKDSQDERGYKNESVSLTMHEDLTTDSKVNLDKEKDTNESSSLVLPEDFTSDVKFNQDNKKEKKESPSLVMPDDLVSNVFSKTIDNTLSNLYALCELWDFAGQKEFYATHQAFLTSSAVYLVVADMKDDISKQGLSQCFADFQDIGEYVDFWFDSIHCHRTAKKPPNDEHFDPPILLVFTGKDKYNKVDFKKRKQELNNQMDQVLGLRSKYHHLHNTFYLSNTEDLDEVFGNLQTAIYEAARTMDTWGNAFPLKWILLEHLIEMNKNDGINFISFYDMSKLAKHPEIKILREDDLMLFLRFQHKVGNIIFFEDIRELIILNPQWLADAFRCLVSDRFDKSRLRHLEDWTWFKRHGKISESLIRDLFNSKDGIQISGQTHNLNKVMEKLDILVKIDNSSYYIMPSMMQSSTFNDVCAKLGINDGKCKRTSWLCFKFEFLPPSFFNHLSAWFIRNYKPSTVDDGTALYRGICMFDIDRSACEKILVTMSTDTIALQVVSFSSQKGFGSKCSGIYSKVKQLIEEIKEKYQVKISSKLHFKCSDGDYYKNTFEYDTLTKNQECFCPQHQTAHRSEQIYSPWMDTEVKEIPDREKINTTQDDQNPDFSENDIISEILKELSNHNERNEEREEAMKQLIKLTREGSFEVWDEHFKTLLLILLETLGDNDEQIRALTLKCLRAILPHQPRRFCDYAELTTLRILEAHKDPDWRVQKAADKCAQTLANYIPPDQCIRILTPIVQSASFPINLGAIRMQIKAVERMPNDALEGKLPDIIPGLVKAYDDQFSTVRKFAVLCLVAIHTKVGDTIWNYLTKLNYSKVKLLKLYIKRNQQKETEKKVGEI